MRRIALAAATAFLGSCQGATDPFTENLDITVCAPSAGGFSTNVTNPYFPLILGSQLVLEGVEDGVPSRLAFTVLNSTEVIAGVTTLVVEERHTENGTLVEVSRNFFVQAADGSVCYFGEDVDIYEGGVIVRNDGQWRAGVAGAVPGIFMPAAPAVGMAFRQEVAPGVAEDRVQIVAVGETVVVPYGTYSNTVRFRETTPLEPGVTSTKIYAGGLGMIVDDTQRLTGKTP